MLFPTLAFAAFFVVVLPVSWLLMPHRIAWRLFMVGASWFFYGSADWRFVPLLVASTMVNHFFVWRIHRSNGPSRKLWTAIAVATNLAGLGWFKYIGFLGLSGQSILHWVGIGGRVPIPEIVLPIGISFFTFQALSYVIDTSRHHVEPVPLLDFAVYLSFFPHLIAGPIVRASEFLPQIRARISPRVDLGKAFWLISSGLFKKVVIASYLGTYAVDPLFGFPHQHAGAEALLGVYAYAVQIYADFSGYTDIAIGLALLLGIEFPDNFNAPYAATSLQDFWRRWHITLSRWLRDYLYVPLGGNRRTRGRTYLNVMATMLLGGLWHGAAWTFVAWGALHGIALAFERWSGERNNRPVAGPASAPTSDQPGHPPASDPDEPVEVSTRPVGSDNAAGATTGTPPSSVALTPLLGDADPFEGLIEVEPVSESPAPRPAGPPSTPESPAAVAATPRPARAGPGPAGPETRARPATTGHMWLGRLITFHVVCLAWIFFRATSFHNAVAVMARILAFGGHHRPFNWKVAAVVATSLAVQWIPRGVGPGIQAAYSRAPLWLQGLSFGLVLSVIDLLGPAGVAPFIYFRF